MTAAHAEPPPPPTVLVRAERIGDRPTLTVQETAEFLGISRWLVQQAVRNGELPHVRIGRRILIPRARLIAMLAGESTAPSASAAGETQGS